MADRLQQSTVIEPIDPFQRCVLHRLQRAPGAASVDHFGLEQADHCLGEGIVVGVSNATHRRFYAVFCQTFGVANGQMLRPVVAVVRQSIFCLSRMQCLLQRIQHQLRVHGAADSPAHDPSGKDIDDEGDVDKPDHVATKVKSLTHNSFGREATKRR